MVHSPGVKALVSARNKLQPPPPHSNHPHRLAVTWTEIFASDFENGWGNFNYGGRDAYMDNGDDSRDGSSLAVIRDDSDRKSSVYSDSFSVSNYSTIKVEFWYMCPFLTLMLTITTAFI